MIDQKDNPALKRTTITSMLSDGATLTAAGMGRAGYGFDALVNQGGGNFYAQKGGSLASSGNVLEFNGQWGFALCWGGEAAAANERVSLLSDGDEHRQKRRLGCRGPIPAIRHAVTVTRTPAATSALCPRRGAAARLLRKRTPRVRGPRGERPKRCSLCPPRQPNDLHPRPRSWSSVRERRHKGAVPL